MKVLAPNFTTFQSFKHFKIVTCINTIIKFSQVFEILAICQPEQCAPVFFKGLVHLQAKIRQVCWNGLPIFIAYIYSQITFLYHWTQNEADHVQTSLLISLLSVFPTTRQTLTLSRYQESLKNSICSLRFIPFIAPLCYNHLRWGFLCAIS